jgi:hypothetical protein
MTYEASATSPTHPYPPPPACCHRRKEEQGPAEGHASVNRRKAAGRIASQNHALYKRLMAIKPSKCAPRAAPPRAASALALAALAVHARSSCSSATYSPCPAAQGHLRGRAGQGLPAVGQVPQELQQLQARAGPGAHWHHYWRPAAGPGAVASRLPEGLHGGGMVSQAVRGGCREVTISAIVARAPLRGACAAGAGSCCSGC